MTDNKLPKRIHVKPDGYTRMLLWQPKLFDDSTEYVQADDYEMLFDWIMDTFWRLFPDETESSIERAMEKISARLARRRYEAVEANYE